MGVNNNTYRIIFQMNQTVIEDVKKKLYEKILEISKSLCYNLNTPIINNIYSYIINPDTASFDNNDNNHTENNITTINTRLKDNSQRDKYPLDYIKPIDSNICLVLINYIYKLLLSNYNVWYEIFNNVLGIQLPAGLTFSITPVGGCDFFMGTIMRRLGINNFHEGMTELYFKSINILFYDNHKYTYGYYDAASAHIESQHYKSYVYGKYDGNDNTITTKLSYTDEKDKNYTRFFILSDTHNYHDKIKLDLENLNIDFLIHAGDLYYEQSRSIKRTIFDDENKSVLEWLHDIDIKTKIIIPGNHDFALEDYELKYRNGEITIDEKDMYDFIYLNDIVYRYKMNDLELNIYGCGFRKSTILNKDRDKYTSNNANEFTQEEITAKINTTLHHESLLDLIITHGAACNSEKNRYNTRESKRCVDISEVINKFKPKLCISGDEHKKYFSNENNTKNEEDILNNSIKIYNYGDSTYGIFVNAPVVNQYNAFVGFPVILDVNTAWLKNRRTT